MQQASLEEIEFAVFDTETTGLDPASGDRVVEIAATKIKGEEEISTFQALVNPGRPISEAAFDVNQITPQMLKGAPAAEEVMPRFLEFIRGAHLCSYNAPFDLAFLNNELRLTGKPALENFAVIDILKMARRLLPGLESYALMRVADKLGINTPQKHRALADVKLTLQVFNKLRRMLYVKGIFDFNSFIGLFGINCRFLEDINNQKIARIQQALDLGVKLKIRYLSRASNQVTEREVLPKQLREDNDRIYLIGHCYLKGEERSFRIDSILHLEYSTV